MNYDQKQARKAERQRKEIARRKRKTLEKAAPELLKMCKVMADFASNCLVINHCFDCDDRSDELGPEDCGKCYASRDLQKAKVIIAVAKGI